MCEEEGEGRTERERARMAALAPCGRHRHLRPEPGGGALLPSPTPSSARRSSAIIAVLPVILPVISRPHFRARTLRSASVISLIQKVNFLSVAFLQNTTLSQ